MANSLSHCVARYIDANAAPWETLPSGYYIGYKVMRWDPVRRQVVSGANSRLSLPLRKGIVHQMPGRGIFMSNSRAYVMDYYAGHDTNVLITYAFDPEHITSGQLDDREPEITVPRARVLAFEFYDEDNKRTISGRVHEFTARAIPRLSVPKSWQVLELLRISDDTQGVKSIVEAKTPRDRVVATVLWLLKNTKMTPHEVYGMTALVLHREGLLRTAVSFRGSLVGTNLAGPPGNPGEAPSSGDATPGGLLSPSVEGPSDHGGYTVISETHRWFVLRKTKKYPQGASIKNQSFNPSLPGPEKKKGKPIAGGSADIDPLMMWYKNQNEFKNVHRIQVTSEPKYPESFVVGVLSRFDDFLTTRGPSDLEMWFYKFVLEVSRRCEVIIDVWRRPGRVNPRTAKEARGEKRFFGLMWWLQPMLVNAAGEDTWEDYLTKALTSVFLGAKKGRVAGFVSNLKNRKPQVIPTMPRDIMHPEANRQRRFIHPSSSYNPWGVDTGVGHQAYNPAITQQW